MKNNFEVMAKAIASGINMSKVMNMSVFFASTIVPTQEPCIKDAIGNAGTRIGAMNEGGVAAETYVQENISVPYTECFF